MRSCLPPPPLPCRAVYAKFQQHTELRDLLLSTGHAKLVEKRKPRSMARHL